MKNPEAYNTVDNWGHAATVIGEDAEGVVEAFLAKHQGGELRPHEILASLEVAIRNGFAKHYPKPERAR
jgi:hypothetical protein